MSTPHQPHVHFTFIFGVCFLSFCRQTHQNSLLYLIFLNNFFTLSLVCLCLYFRFSYPPRSVKPVFWRKFLAPLSVRCFVPLYAYQVCMLVLQTRHLTPQTITVYVYVINLSLAKKPKYYFNTKAMVLSPKDDICLLF